MKKKIFIVLYFIIMIIPFSKVKAQFFTNYDSDLDSSFIIDNRNCFSNPDACPEVFDAASENGIHCLYTAYDSKNKAAGSIKIMAAIYTIGDNDYLTFWFNADNPQSGDIIKKSNKDGRKYVLVHGETKGPGIYQFPDFNYKDYDITGINMGTGANGFPREKIIEDIKKNRCSLNLDMDLWGEDATLTFTTSSVDVETGEHYNPGEEVDENGMPVEKLVCTYNFVTDCEPFQLILYTTTNAGPGWKISYKGSTSNYRLEKSGDSYANSVISFSFGSKNYNFKIQEPFWRDLWGSNTEMTECPPDGTIGFLQTAESYDLTFDLFENESNLLTSQCPSHSTSDTFGGTGQGTIAKKACEDEGILRIMKMVAFFIILVQVLVPIVLIVIGIVNLSNAIMNGDDSKLKPAIYAFVSKVIIGAIIAFVPEVIEAIVSTIDKYNNSKTDYSNCLTCMDSIEECDKLIEKYRVKD